MHFGKYLQYRRSCNFHDFLIKAASKGMEEGKFFEAEVALHNANELTAAWKKPLSFEEKSNG